MNRVARVSIIFFACGVAVANAIAAESTAEVGEWAIKLTPKPNNTLEHTDKEYGDELKLKDAKLTSLVCSKYQFSPAPYAGKSAAGNLAFKSDMKSAKHGVAVWTFAVKDGKIEGTFVWEKAGKRAEFTFTGERKSDAKK